MFIQKLKIIFSILLCLLTGGNFFQGVTNLFRAGNVDMIGNNHLKSFATEYTGSEDHARFDRLAGKHAAIDVLLRPISQKPSFLEKIFLDIYAIKLVRQYFAD